jgi:hypothetical protein
MSSCGGCLLMIIGLMTLAGIYWIHTEQVAFARIAQTTTGTVIDLRRGSGKNAGYYPTVQFLTRRERVYTFEAAMTSDHQIGDQVEILYNPEAPEQAVIAVDNSITTNHGMWFAIAVGMVLLIIGSTPFARRLKRLRERLSGSNDA